MKEGESRQAARPPEWPVSLPRDPFVWPFTNRVTGLSLAAGAATLAQLHDRSEPVCTLFPGNSAGVVTRPGGEEQTIKTVALSLRHSGGVGAWRRGGWGAGEGIVGVQGRRGASAALGVSERASERARGYAAACSQTRLRRELALGFIDSLCKGAAESRPASPAPANQSMFTYLYGLLRRNSGR